MLGAIPPSPMEPPPSNEAIRFDWGVLTGPRLPSYIHFQITVQVCGRDVPQTMIDEGLSVSILSSIAWKALGCPPLASVTQNLLSFKETSQPLGTLPQFPVTLGGKTVFIDIHGSPRPLGFFFTPWARLCLCHESYCVYSFSCDIFPSRWTSCDF
jgi:hypothetical protein